MKYTVYLTLGYRFENIEADSPEEAREMIEDDDWDRHLIDVQFDVEEREG